ncbi:hypothetical protein N8I77_010602 [Diaporthe amygdali]|uniref:Major facilitator superfamily (MFS) profile domain-containing protein n=1 Tax=Phomopsis amygdali TaxID=1214568 RepID=A0AAD9S8C6_PHOAM|nr:hypothetical protein N8I77_010602 [Diaporthe amygdali]
MAFDIPGPRPQQDVGHVTEQLDPFQAPPISLMADVEKSTTLPHESETSIDRFEVTFDGTADSANPLNWSTRTKWTVTSVLAITGFNNIMVSTIVAPAITSISKELHMSSMEPYMAYSIYALATAFGPLLIGPLSEIHGRQRVLHASNTWFLGWNIVCGFAHNKSLLIASRFLAGFGASAIFALSGGVLGDIWTPEDRGRSLGVYLLLPLFAAAVGPIIGGFIDQYTTWRWMFWATSIFQAFMSLVSCFAYHETYVPLILGRRASKLRKETGDARYHTVYERLDSKHSSAMLIYHAMTRPLRLLAFHPIIQITSLIYAFWYGTLYIVLSSFSTLWTSQYGESVSTSGLHYIACALGEMVGAQLGGPLMDWLYRYMVNRSPDKKHRPEFRIPLTYPGGLLAPLGLFIYGWTSHYRVHWIAVDIGVFVFMAAGQVNGMPLQAYIIDAYPDHVSSALAASQFLRSLTAFLFPLFVPSMYSTLGYGWGNSLLGFAGLFFGLPAPAILWYWGVRLREREKWSR